MAVMWFFLQSHWRFLSNVPLKLFIAQTHRITKYYVASEYLQLYQGVVVMYNIYQAIKLTVETKVAMGCASFQHNIQ